MKFVSGFSVFALLVFGFPVRSLEGSLQRAYTCGESEAKPDYRQPVLRVELSIQPSTAEEAEENAEREVESDRGVATDPFPAVIHRYCKKRALK